MGERIGFGLYQFCGNMGIVGRVSVFGFRLCGWEDGVVLCMCVL